MPKPARLARVAGKIKSAYHATRFAQKRKLKRELPLKIRELQSEIWRLENDLERLIRNGPDDFRLFDNGKEETQKRITDATAMRSILNSQIRVREKKLAALRLALKK